MGDGHPKTDGKMTYPEKRNINKAIHQKLSKKDVYETDMHKIYNIIVGQTNGKFHEKAASGATFQVINSVRYPIGYLIILKKL